jgi:hypothetical protein
LIITRWPSRQAPWRRQQYLSLVKRNEEELVMKSGEKNIPGGGDSVCKDTEVTKGWQVWGHRVEFCMPGE